MNGQTLWIAGRVFSQELSKEWEFIGLFLSENEAVDVCSRALDFVAPAVVGERLPEESVDWPGAYYPLVSTR